MTVIGAAVVAGMQRHEGARTNRGEERVGRVRIMPGRRADAADVDGPAEPLLSRDGHLVEVVRVRGADDEDVHVHGDRAGLTVVAGCP